MRLFDIRAGEGRRVLWAGGAMFSILFAHILAETARDSMFLRSLSASRLAIAYGALAILAVLAMRANALLVRRIGRRHALVATLMFAAYGTAIFYMLPAHPAVVLGLYLWTGLLAAVIVVQFWLVASATFTSSEAKRLFGPILALGGLGALGGAFGAAGLLFVIRVEQLLPISAGFYLIAAAFFVRQQRQLDVPRVSFANNRTPRLRQHPYAMRLAVLVILSTAVALLADFLFKATAARELAAGELPAFLARYNGIVAATSLALQLVGASWLMRRLGVLGTIVLLPAILLLGGVAIAVTATALVATALTKGADATLRQSVNRVSAELLWMPVPVDVRAALREPIESVVTRIAQAVTAAVLLAISLLGEATRPVVAGMLLALTALWLGIAVGLRRQYLEQLRSALARPAFVAEQELDVASIEVVIEALSSTEVRRVIAAIEILTAHERVRLIPSLILYHDAPEVLIAALDALVGSGRRDWIALAERLVGHRDPAVRVAAIRVLARSGSQSAVQSGLEDLDPVVRGHAVFWKAHLGPTDAVATDSDVLSICEGNEDPRTSVALLEAIDTSGDLRWADVVLALLRRPDAAVVVAAIGAIERAPDPRFVSLLIDKLDVRAIRTRVRAALLRIGDAALAELARSLGDFTKSPRVRLHIPTTLAQFSSQAAADHLLGALAQEQSGAVRYRILRALARLSVAHRVHLDRSALFEELRHHLREHFRLLAISTVISADGVRGDSADLLHNLLSDKISQALDRSFLVVQSLHPGEDVRPVERALERTDRVARAHAIEFLDILTRSAMFERPEAQGLRSLLLLACDELPAADRVARASQSIVQAPVSASQALESLMHDHDSLLAATAAYHARHLDHADLRKTVLEVAKSRPIIDSIELALSVVRLD